MFAKESRRLQARGETLLVFSGHGIKHRSHDDGCSVSAPDDNCNDRWDWVVNVYVVGGVRDPHWRQIECADNDESTHWETAGEDSGEDCGEDCP